MALIYKLVLAFRIGKMSEHMAKRSRLSTEEVIMELDLEGGVSQWRMEVMMNLKT